MGKESRMTVKWNYCEHTEIGQRNLSTGQILDVSLSPSFSMLLAVHKEWLELEWSGEPSRSKEISQYLEVFKDLLLQSKRPYNTNH